MIGNSQKPLLDKAQHSQETNFRAPSGIRNRNPRKWAVVTSRLRPRGHSDGHWVSIAIYISMSEITTDICVYIYIYIYIYIYNGKRLFQKETKVPCTLGWPYIEGTWLYCDYFIWCVSCSTCTVVFLTCFVICVCMCRFYNLWMCVCMGFVMCGSVYEWVF
jgi:hypothetical protein